MKQMKKLLGIIFGVIFAMVVMPKIAKFTLSAKYKKSGVAYAAEAKTEKPFIATCANQSANTASIGDVAMRIKCRGEVP
jgi:hypothetical protein